MSRAFHLQQRFCCERHGTCRKRLRVLSCPVAHMEKPPQALGSQSAEIDREMKAPGPKQHSALFRSIREALESEKVVTEEPGGYVVIKRRSQATQTELSATQEDPAGYTVIRRHNVPPVARGRGDRGRHSRGSHHATGQRSGRSTTAERHPVHRRRSFQQQEQRQLRTGTQTTEPPAPLPLFTADLVATSLPESSPAQSWTTPPIGSSSVAEAAGAADVPMESDGGSWPKADESTLGTWGPSMWLNSADPGV